MKFRLLAGVCILLVTAGSSLAQLVDPNSPVKPGTVRVSTKAPELDKWDLSVGANGAQRLYKCKPLACSDPLSVSFNILKSPTAKPDPKALEKYATVDVPKSIRALAAASSVMLDTPEKVDTLLSKTATLKGYPSVVNESRLTRGNVVTYIQLAIIFAGPIMIRVNSSSANRELAKKSLGEFLEVMQIIQGPPLPPPGTAGPPATTRNL